MKIIIGDDLKEFLERNDLLKEFKERASTVFKSNGFKYAPIGNDMSGAFIFDQRWRNIDQLYWEWLVEKYGELKANEVMSSKKQKS